MIKAHVIISGSVQGVGFRYFVKEKALELGLTGWVKNAPDGRVEAVFQGEKEKLDKVIAFCRQAPFPAEVQKVQVEWEEVPQSYTSFDIIA